MFLIFFWSLSKRSKQPTTLPFDDQSSLCSCSCLFNTLVKSLNILISFQYTHRFFPCYLFHFYSDTPHVTSYPIVFPLKSSFCFSFPQPFLHLPIIFLKHKHTYLHWFHSIPFHQSLTWIQQTQSQLYSLLSFIFTNLYMCSHNTHTRCDLLFAPNTSLRGAHRLQNINRQK